MPTRPAAPTLLVAALLTVATLQTPAASAAATEPGALDQLAGASACIEGTGAPSWTTCPSIARGLLDARTVAISPDGRNAYAASSLGSTLVSFSREPTGELTQLAGSAGCVRDSSASAADCPDVAAGLNGALSVAVSPDGRNVYVASINVGQVASFSRDPSSGALSQLPGAAGCVQDVKAQPDSSCPGTARGIHGARWVTVSPDGRNVYVTSPVADSVAAFARDGSSGALSQLAGNDACVRDVNQVDPVKSDCPRTVDGLKYPRSLAISPDGTDVYVASNGSHAIAVLSRSAATGGLHPATGPGSCVASVTPPLGTACQTRARGVGAVFGVAVSPDGRSVYAASDDTDSVAAFTRPGSGGTLRQLPGSEACITDVNPYGTDDCEVRARGLDGAEAVTLSPDGKRVYVSSFYGGAVAAFSRDSHRGALRQLGGDSACVAQPSAPSTPPRTSCPTAANGLEGVRPLTLSPDGRNAYVPGSGGDTIALFGIVGGDRDGPFSVAEPGRQKPQAGRPPSCASAIRAPRRLDLSRSPRRLAVRLRLKQGSRVGVYAKRVRRGGRGVRRRKALPAGSRRVVLRLRRRARPGHYRVRVGVRCTNGLQRKAMRVRVVR